MPFSSTINSPSCTVSILQDAVIADHAFGYAGKKAIAGEVVHAVYIQLPGNKLVEKGFMGIYW